MPSKTALALASLCVLGLATPALAQTDREATSIIRSLAPVSPPLAAPMGGASAAAPVRAAPPARRPRVVIAQDRGARVQVTVDASRTRDFAIRFATDSAEIGEYAADQLAGLGAALRSPELSPYRFLVAGHTDARGDFDHNMDLSLRRAFAVRDHLVAFYGIPADRLLVSGYGSTALRVPGDPASGLNRRVEVALVVTVAGY
ncbi:OmpA family protein [Salinarimonas soli]|uniref:OmpA family protein n=1 Tax=Salinarimonas soli TaxID=1638099 RepID=A0A5B2V9Q0_9HYPH|nr:OmpA family protein [Salinarimonas soli]KAA2235069.1 OmpA family protein [Salinarimonas soli]